MCRRLRVHLMVVTLLAAMMILQDGIDRSIGRQPAYVANPRYALLLLDGARRWIAMDKSRPDAPDYDVAYVDVNGNGDLTDAGERFTGAGHLWIGDLAGHTRVELKRAAGTHHWIELRWNGGELLRCGIGERVMTWSSTPAAAPVLRPAAGGKMDFRLSRTRSLLVGKRQRIAFQLGREGSEPDAFCAVSDTFLDLAKDRIVVTLLAKDRRGAELRVPFEIRHHC